MGCMWRKCAILCPGFCSGVVHKVYCIRPSSAMKTCCALDNLWIIPIFSALEQVLDLTLESLNGPPENDENSTIVTGSLNRT